MITDEGRSFFDSQFEEMKKTVSHGAKETFTKDLASKIKKGDGSIPPSIAEIVEILMRSPEETTEHVLVS